MRRLVLAATALAGLSLLGPAQPSYDAWAWLLWGREIGQLELSTVDGPAWKPLPVLLTVPLAALGDAAPALWLLIARAGALLAIGLAARLAWRLAPRARPVAAIVAALAVAATGGWWWHGAVGHTEGLFLALVLAAADRAMDGRHRAALALAFAAALLRPEAWPLLGLYGLWRWRTAEDERPWLLAAPLALAALWFGPELWGSGDLGRSGARARILEPGQPGTAAVPALASLGAALALAPLPLLAPALAAPRSPARLVLAAGLAWVALVALMAQVLGTSGEARYALPGVALLAVAAGAGAARLTGSGHGRIALAAVAAIAVALAPARLADTGAELARVADEAELYGSLDDAVSAAGGPAAIRALGRPATGRFRGPAVAYVLKVPKARVLAPGRGAVVLRSRIRRGATVQPPASGRVLARSARWEIVATGRP